MIGWDALFKLAETRLQSLFQLKVTEWPNSALLPTKSVNLCKSTLQGSQVNPVRMPQCCYCSYTELLVAYTWPVENRVRFSFERCCAILGSKLPGTFIKYLPSDWFRKRAGEETVLPYFILLHEIQIRKNSGCFPTPVHSLFHSFTENVSYKRQQSGIPPWILQKF